MKNAIQQMLKQTNNKFLITLKPPTYLNIGRKLDGVVIKRYEMKYL